MLEEKGAPVEYVKEEEQAHKEQDKIACKGKVVVLVEIIMGGRIVVAVNRIQVVMVLEAQVQCLVDIGGRRHEICVDKLARTWVE